MKNYFQRLFLVALAATACVIPFTSAQEALPSSPPPAKHDPASQKDSEPPGLSGHLDSSKREVIGTNRMKQDEQITRRVTAVMVFTFPVLIVGIVAYARHARARALHQTLRLMVEKGAAIPPELLVPPIARPKRAPDDFRRGVVLISLGIGLIAMLSTHSASGAWRLGFVPLLLGAGYLVLAKLGTKPAAGSGASPNA